MSNKTIYRIFFTSQGKAYELYARKVEQADLHGFVMIEGLLFGNLPVCCIILPKRV